MKSTLATVIIAAAAISSSGQVAPEPVITAAPRSVVSPTNDPSAAPPVRLPPSTTAAPIRTPSGTNGVTSVPVLEPIGWSSDAVELRPSLRLLPDTNRIMEVRSVLPRLTRTERRGFGGFLASFANLFNPLAPVEEGVSAGGEHWYDGRITTAPLPRGMRDERYHESKWELYVVGLDGPGSGPRR
jgi:hypothetical protein